MHSSAFSQMLKAPCTKFNMDLTTSQQCIRCHYPQWGSPSLPRARRHGKSKIQHLPFRDNNLCAMDGTDGFVEREGGRTRGGRRSMLGGGLAAGMAVCMSAIISPDSTLLEVNHGGGALSALPYKPEGYKYWDWRGFKVHYVEGGQSDESLPPILLIHGFGASSFHWRYNIPELAAKGHRVYAMCLLGFGWSEKTTGVDYSQQLWSEQISDFIREVVGGPVIIAGNSLGGYAALLTSVSSPDLVKGLVVLNGAGEFGSSNRRKKEVEVSPQGWVEERIKAPFQKLVERVLVYFTFWQAKQPARIEAVLRQVYKDQSMVDDYLVQSIVKPSLDPGAAQVYYKVVTETLLHPSNEPLDKLYGKLDKPLLLLWGVFDPWMSARKAEAIKVIYPSATYVPLQAGHCPHDEVPDQVNKALLEWIAKLPA